MADHTDIPIADVSICPRCLERMERILAPQVVRDFDRAESSVDVYDHCAACNVYYNFAHVVRAEFAAVDSDNPFGTIEDYETARRAKWVKLPASGGSEEIADIDSALDAIRKDDRPALGAAGRRLEGATFLGMGKPIWELLLCPTCREECELVGGGSCTGSFEAIQTFAYCRPCGIFFETIYQVGRCHDHDGHDQRTEEFIRRCDEALAGLREVQPPAWAQE